MSDKPDVPPAELSKGETAERELLRAALSSIGDAVITTDTHGQITALNPAAQSLTGWTLEEATGELLARVFQIVNEETRQAIESPAARALRDDVSVGPQNHTLLIAKDATEHPIDDSAATIRGPAGAVAGVVLAFRNVAARPEDGPPLQDTLDEVASILATLSRPLLILDAELRVIAANGSFCRVFKLAPAETEQRLLYELGGGLWDIPELRERLQDVLPHSRPLDDFEVADDFPGIGRRVMRLNARPLVRDGRQTDHIQLTIEDVTARLRGIEALQDSELKYRRLFEAAQDGILILTADTGQITEANPFIEQILGRPRAELLGQHLWDIGLLTDMAENEAKFVELREQGYVRYDHLPLETADGRQTQVEFVSNVYDVGGRQVIQCNIRDISDRVTLERKTEEQSRQLAELDRRKDEFLAMLSHELRSPLAPIVNAAYLLRLQSNETSIQRHAREVIERQSAHLTQLVDDLLEVSRITTGRIQLRKERIALGSLVERAVGSVLPEIERRRHELSVSVPPEPIWVDADSVRLEQVVVNLITNAAKYTEDGGHIWLTVNREQDTAIIRLRDTGIGIAPDVLPNVFDLFAQAERSLARSEGGLGIGLALVKRLTELHGGSVDVYSALGRGSELLVRLPVAPDPEFIVPASIRRPTGRNMARSLGILVVDDNLDTARTFQLLLEDEGHRVKMAHDGPSALQAALEFRPDVILLDIGLPGWDGYEVARRIRQEPTLHDVVLVAVTGYGRESDEQHAREAGFDHHLVKPPDFDALEAILTTAGRRLVAL